MVMDAIRPHAAIAAHRGWHVDGAPENGIAALERAHAGGADWVEVDIRRLGDGTMVIHHDPRLEGQPLHRLDRTVLTRHPEIATLDDWARRAGELEVGVLAELKEAGYEADALRTVRAHVAPERLDLMSFKPSVVRRLAALAPDRPVGLLTYDLPATRVVRNAVSPSSLMRSAAGLGASFVGLNVSQATPRMLAAADRAGMGVAVWTVDDSTDLARLIADPRVATVISDVPGDALAIRAGIAGAEGASAGIRLLRAAATMR